VGGGRAVAVGEGSAGFRGLQRGGQRAMLEYGKGGLRRRTGAARGRESRLTGGRGMQVCSGKGRRSMARRRGGRTEAWRWKMLAARATG
jgi:hypothetical protein